MARIYLSSTYSDLIPYRKAVYDTLRTLRHDVLAMEHYGATDQRPVDKCLADVAECDLYVGLFARRYGSIPPAEHDNPQQRSVTELEYREATRLTKPRCIFFLDDPVKDWPEDMTDQETGEGDGGARIAVLRQELGQEHLVSFFRSPNHLAREVSVAVSLWEKGAVPSTLALPLDTLPAPASLPPGSHMPLPRHTLFVGRETALLQLATLLQGGDTAAIGQIAAATGLGGIGKTQLASEFVHRYGQFFAGGVCWLSFADAAAVPAQVAACGFNLAPDFASQPLEAQVQQVQRAWQDPVPRLLVFDNCEDAAVLAQWRPTTGGCRVVVTSRLGQWGAVLGVGVLALEVLPRPESIALLRKHRPELAEDDADLDALANELGDLPLALHLAGSFLETYRDDVSSQ